MEHTRIIKNRERGFTHWKILGLVVVLLLLAALAIPHIVRPHTTTAPSACVNNLRLIDLAKYEWAQEKGKGPDDLPTVSDLQPYFRGGTAGLLPTCPADSSNSFATSYSINNVASRPTCKILPTSHVLR
jgi:hypothetical protein